jgi:hypothetical protein
MIAVPGLRALPVHIVNAHIARLHRPGGCNRGQHSI